MNSTQRRFDGRVAIVTGAGRGIGRAYAEMLASRGAAVVVNDLGVATRSGGEPSSVPADEVVENLRDNGHQAIANYCDIGDPESGRAIVDAALGEFGRVDIVISNAGTVAFHSIEDLSADRFAQDLSVHLGGAFHLSRAAWPHLKKQGYGRILMTSSTSIFGQDNAASYAAAKAGILGLTSSLAIEGVRHGILVNAVAPSAATRMAVSPVASVSSNTARPELAAEAAGWLVHEDCAMNGEAFHAGNGRLSRIFIGETHGYVDADLTVESVATNEKRVMDEHGYIVPADVYEAITFHRSLTPTP